MFGQKYDPQKAKEQKERGNVPWVKRFPKGESQFRFRPLVEIDELVTYFEVWDKQIKRGWPIDEDTANSTEFPEHQEAKRKPLLPIVALKEDKSWAWACPWAVVDYLTTHSELKGTITDTDFICVRSGTGLDTEYSVVPDEKIARDLSKYDPIDAEEVLRNGFQHAVDEGYTDGTLSEAQETPATESAPETAAQEPEPTPAPDQEPEAEPEGEKVAPPTSGQDRTAGLPEDWETHTVAKLRTYARERKISPSGMNRQEIIDAIKGDDAL